MYQPWSKIYYANDILPKEYHEQFKGWTVDGALCHHNNPKSPWSLIVNRNLQYVIHYANTLHELKIKQSELDKTKSKYDSLVSEIIQLRQKFRVDKEFKASDSLRELLKKFDVNLEDTKL